MGRILTIALREYAEMVKTKTFILSLLATPLLIVGIGWIGTRIQHSVEKGSRPPERVLVVDLEGDLLSGLREKVESHNRRTPGRRIGLETLAATDLDQEQAASEVSRRVRERQVGVGLVIPKDAIDGKQAIRYYGRGDAFQELDLFQALRGLVNDALIDVRCERLNMSRDLIDEIRRRADFDRIDVTAGAKQSEGKMVMSMMVPFFFMFLLFMGMVGINQHMLTSVIEEKNSRVVEVLLASVSPFQLMAGKIAGLSAVGLTVTSIWGVAALGSLAGFGLGDVIAPAALVYFLAYYVLGSVFYSAVYAAVGAACNTLKEAQPLIMPVTMVLVIPMAGWVFFAQNPTGPWSVALSLIPPFSPLVMIVRLSVQPSVPFYQVFASILILAASVAGAMWVSARVFRVGILLYGKPPTPREMLRWIRES
ncbi:ABC transporter permease [Candidatus Sumerlaeota bacterium]|nr:ABC transporter permease [Candidatus Sumerlaeota bacterium]